MSDDFAAGMRRAAEICGIVRARIACGPMPEGARFDYERAILAAIPPAAPAINWGSDPDAIVEDDEPQIGRDYA